MDNSTFDEIIDLAREKEQEAVDFYRRLAAQVEARNIREALLEMAAMEERHKQQLGKIGAGAFSVAGGAVVNDLRLAAQLPDVTPTPGMDYQQLLIIAIKREEKAEKLYRHLAAVAGDDEQKKILDGLAAEEGRHRFALEKEYDEKVLEGN